MAAFAVAPLTSAIKIGISDLVQHTARLQDATNENKALDLLIPAFDADLKTIAAAFNAGADKQTCIQACLLVDTNASAYLQQQVGKTGTAWTGGPKDAAIGQSINPSYPAPCNKTCTAGCCVYLNDLRPAIFGRNVTTTGGYGPFQTAPGIVGGLIGAMQNGKGVVHVVPVAPPSNKSYGDYSRATYDLTVQAPPLLSMATVALQATGSGVGLHVTASAPKTATVTSKVSSLFSALTSTEIVAIIGVVGGLLLIITTLFGANALRVNK